MGSEEGKLGGSRRDIWGKIGDKNFEEIESYAHEIPSSKP